MSRPFKNYGNDKQKNRRKAVLEMESTDSSSEYAAMSDNSPPSRRRDRHRHRSNSRDRNSKRNHRNTSSSYSPERPLYDDLNTSPRKSDGEEDIYIVSQSHGYCSILFAVLQTIILGFMMWQCQVAPFNINPMIGPYPDALSEWGGKNSILILEDGQWWRLVTPIFLHAGLIHLAGNVLVQVETGAFFEQEWGSLRWLIVYLTSAVGSSILSVIVMPDAVSVGSSGAVMGLFGGKAAEVVIRMFENYETAQEKLAHEVRKEQCIAVSCGATIVLLFSFIPYVDWAAHLGGLVAGFLVGFIVFAYDAPGIPCKFFTLAVGLATCGVAFAYALAYMYSGNVEAIEELRDVCSYYKEAFEDYECNCMREEYLQNFQNNGGNNGE